MPLSFNFYSFGETDCRKMAILYLPTTKRKERMGKGERETKIKTRRGKKKKKEEKYEKYCPRQVDLTFIP